MCLLINCSAYASCKLPKGFTYLRDVDNSIDQTISFATSDNCIGHPLAGYEAQEAICTLALAKELKKVQNSLKKINPYYSLSILDIYRPTDAVKDIINWAKDKDDIKTKQRCYPDLDKSELLGDYVASVKSAHSRGSTVDIIILDTRTKQPLDFGPRFFGKYVHVNYSGLTPIQKENRLMLRNLMIKHHFKPYDKEFWHFTLLNEPFPQTQFNFKICNPLSIQGEHPMTDASDNNQLQ
ncbi:MAG: M15 family metallopeptidase [Legionellaceae bacterium]|nr:M15 family metallopeptidase [Legionellaceae bacterium]